MPIVRVFAYICFGFAALGVLIAFSEGAFFLGSAATLFVAGVFCLAVDKIIVTLVEIRDAIRGSENRAMDTSKSIETAIVPEKAPKSLAELSADLERLKAKL